MNIEFLPQRHEAPGAKISQMDQDVLASQIAIARHLLKNKDAIVFIEGNATNMPEMLSPDYYRRCNTRLYDRDRCGYPSLWRSIRGAQLYFRTFDFHKDLQGDENTPLLQDPVFRSNIVTVGAPAFLYFTGAIRYVIFSDSAAHVDNVSAELKDVEQLFGSLSGCFMAVPKSRLHRIMFPTRERHVLSIIDRIRGGFMEQKRILVFGGLHDFTAYNGSKYRFMIPAEFTNEAAHGRRAKRELASACTDLVTNVLIQGAIALIVWSKKMLTENIRVGH